MGKLFIRHCVMMMCDEKKYNPQGGSILACIITQGRLRCTCQPCAIESITRWGMGTPHGLVEMGRGGLHMGG